jgi:CTP synthase
LSGLSPDGRLVEIVELRDHPWFVASQFHPELKSRPTRPHPLFREFVSAVKTNAHKPIEKAIETRQESERVTVS